MFIRVTRGQHDSSKAEEFKRAVPAVKTVLEVLPGCQSVHSGMDHQAGTSVSVSIFDTREHASFARESLGEPFKRLTTMGYTAHPPEIDEES